MNANELAEDLEGAKLVILRLQAEIAALKYEKSSGVYDAEPVAWWAKNRNTGIGYVQISKPTRMDKVANEYLPLYTHPAKTLTDEEIMLVSDEFKGLPVTSVEAWNKVILLFAKAILRKAQE